MYIYIYRSHEIQAAAFGRRAAEAFAAGSTVIIADPGRPAPLRAPRHAAGRKGGLSATATSDCRLFHLDDLPCYACDVIYDMCVYTHYAYACRCESCVCM